MSDVAGRIQSTIALRRKTTRRPAKSLSDFPPKPISRTGLPKDKVVWALTAQLPVFDSSAPPNPTTAAIERAFATIVAERIHAGVLSYSDRLSLLKAAHRLHIERFRANLIIALVQRATGTATPEPKPASRLRSLFTYSVIALLIEARRSRLCGGLSKPDTPHHRCTLRVYTHHSIINNGIAPHATTHHHSSNRDFPPPK